MSREAVFIHQASEFDATKVRRCLSLLEQLITTTRWETRVICARSLAHTLCLAVPTTTRYANCGTALVGWVCVWLLLFLLQALLSAGI
jgi:hypothetical protein